MRKYRWTVLSAVIFAAALSCAFHTSLILNPGAVLIFLIPQFILLGLQFCEVIHKWKEFRESVGEEACEKVPLIMVYKEKIFYTPFVMTLRAMMVMLGINPDRAGPSFVIL